MCVDSRQPALSKPVIFLPKLIQHKRLGIRTRMAPQMPKGGLAETTPSSSEKGWVTGGRAREPFSRRIGRLSHQHWTQNRTSRRNRLWQLEVGHCHIEHSYKGGRIHD